MSILFCTFVIEKISNNNQNRSGMEETKTYVVVITTGDDNHECHMQTFYCEMMAINYIEHELLDDVNHGEGGEYHYYLNNQLYA